MSPTTLRGVPSSGGRGTSSFTGHHPTGLVPVPASTVTRRAMCSSTHPPPSTQHPRSHRCKSSTSADLGCLCASSRQISQLSAGNSPVESPPLCTSTIRSNWPINVVVAGLQSTLDGAGRVTCEDIPQYFPVLIGFPYSPMAKTRPG